MARMPVAYRHAGEREAPRVREVRMQDEIIEPPGSHEPTEYHKTPKKAAASG
jgi:hypothetical protein